MTGEFEVTKMSSKGQIVVPQEIRNKLNLEEGAKFLVVGMGDTIVLKRIQAPKFEKFEEIMRKGREIARKKGLKPRDVEKAIADYRKEKGR